eukprot:13753383-Heterocapsa_arctica.AAC.1
MQNSMAEEFEYTRSEIRGYVSRIPTTLTRRDEEAEPQQEDTGARRNDMDEKQEIKVLNWLINNQEMGQAATRPLNKYNFTQNRKINQVNTILGTHLFDALNGGKQANRKGVKTFDLETNSNEGWVPWERSWSTSRTP